LFLWLVFCVCVFLFCFGFLKLSVRGSNVRRCMQSTTNTALAMSSIPAHVELVWIKPLNFGSVVSQDTRLRSTNLIIEYNDITEILSKVALRTNTVLCLVSFVTHCCITLTSKWWQRKNNDQQNTILKTKDRATIKTLYRKLKIEQR
jgi:hypothetical protein